ncbi:Sulfotransferase domain [Nesidiocoris tenuis]|uniref:Sulfotransferase domain n=1 Tax=Nesidiocoris tenuis TaxID=355587 RepID=A0ABN7B2K4_9HEMI|nr:Sulfotransferase domain [Nesidiocoris tenuis]
MAEFPYEIADLDEKVNSELLSHFEGERSGFVRVGPTGWILPSAYKQHAQGFYSMPLRPDDVWIVTFPRSGTTWCQELVWLINNNLDYERSAELALDNRFPFYEFCILHHPDFHKDVIAANNNNPEVTELLSFWRRPGYEFLSTAESPRHMKTHLPFSLLPPDLTKTCKTIYVARNPKDVAASYFHHNSLLRLHGYNGDFKKYWDFFEKDLLVYSPYSAHLKEGWARRHDPNVLFLFYEDLILDLPSSVRKVAAFLKKTLTDDDVDKLVKHLHIDNFKKAVKVHEDVPLEGMVNNNFATGFFRRGGIGGNKEYDEELSQRVEQYTQRLTEDGIVFPTKN